MTEQTRARVERGSPRALRWLGLALFCGGGWGLGGCSGDERPPPLSAGRGRPVEGCEQFSYQTCDIREAGCQSDLFGLVACLRGESAAADGPPPVTLLSEAEATELLQGPAEPAADPSAQDDFSPSVRGLELLGLIDPGLISAPSDGDSWVFTSGSTVAPSGTSNMRVTCGAISGYGYYDQFYLGESDVAF